MSRLFISVQQVEHDHVGLLQVEMKMSSCLISTSSPISPCGRSVAFLIRVGQHHTHAMAAKTFRGGHDDPPVATAEIVDHVAGAGWIRRPACVDHIVRRAHVNTVGRLDVSLPCVSSSAIAAEDAACSIKKLKVKIAVRIRRYMAIRSS